MLLAALELVANEPGASRERIREHLSGNYCRCTGYQAIVDAVEDVLAARRKKRYPYQTPMNANERR